VSNEAEKWWTSLGQAKETEVEKYDEPKDQM
jgi:hypothetical protein